MTTDDRRLSSITEVRDRHSPTLAELEQAELEARQRHADAEIEAERRLEAGRVEARAIEAGAAQRIADAVEEVRDQVGAQARERVAAIERAIAVLETDGAGSGSAEVTQRFERTVEQIVEAVLLERKGP